MSVATVTLDKELIPTNISGTVDNIQLYDDGKLRLTLSDTVIRGTKPLTLVNIRVTKFDDMPYIGDKVEIHAGLMPPPGPSMPDDYDYACQVWFQGISAVGYAVSPLKITECTTGISTTFDQMRQRMAQNITEKLTGESGTLAAALITGIRGAMPDPLIEAMRGERALLICLLFPGFIWGCCVVWCFLRRGWVCHYFQVWRLNIL